MVEERLVLGDVMQLVFQPDVEAGPLDELLRDRLEMEVMNKLFQLPPETDVARLESGIAAGMERLRAKADSSAIAASTDFHILGILIMIRGSAPDGALFAGCRWWLVRREQVDQQAFRSEYMEAARRLARHVAH